MISIKGLEFYGEEDGFLLFLRTKEKVISYKTDDIILKEYKLEIEYDIYTDNFIFKKDGIEIARFSKEHVAISSDYYNKNSRKAINLAKDLRGLMENL